MIKQQ